MLGAVPTLSGLDSRREAATILQRPTGVNIYLLHPVKTQHLFHTKTSSNRIHLIAQVEKLVADNCEVEDVEGSVVDLKIINAAVHVHSPVHILIRKHRAFQVPLKIRTRAVAAHHLTRQPS